MLPDRVSNPGPLTYESGALPIALRGPAFNMLTNVNRPYRLNKKTTSFNSRPHINCIAFFRSNIGL